MSHPVRSVRPPDYLGLKGILTGGVTAIGVVAGIVVLADSDLEGWPQLASSMLGCILVYALSIIGHEVEWDRWERKHRPHRFG